MGNRKINVRNYDARREDEINEEKQGIKHKQKLLKKKRIIKWLRPVWRAKEENPIKLSMNWE